MKMQVDYKPRFKKGYGKLPADQQKCVREAVALFLADPQAVKLDFKQRTGSRYFTIRATYKLRIAMTKVSEGSFVLEFVGNHDDINSLDRQGR